MNKIINLIDTALDYVTQVMIVLTFPFKFLIDLINPF